MKPALVIIVPAHNEALNISHTLLSLMATKPADIVVIADNCTDDTAKLAEECGARVIIRNNPDKLGKPYALAYALDILMTEGYLYYAFMDADTCVEANFADALLNAFKDGADAVQVRYVQQSSNPSLRQRLSDIAFFANTILRPLGRTYWGLSCGILGNGFALTAETLSAVPFRVDSIVEDLVYHTQLVSSGRKVIFTTQTTVRALMADSDKAMRTQHSRWEGGRLAALKDRGPTLFRLICQGRHELLEPLLDMLLPPVAFHTVTILLLFLLPWPIVHLYAWLSLGAVGLYCLTAVCMRKEILKDGSALCLAPFYLLWKITMIPGIISSAKNAAWNRTDRNRESK